MFQPAIKWSGSKRSQVNKILEYFPDKIDTYYEPFCGGCSVLRGLLESNISVEHYVCSDLNEDLINLWKYIKECPSEIITWYSDLWHELNVDNDLERKKQFFYEIRERLNKEHNPLDFMFIMRTTTNGMPRYNKEGAFNNSFHVTRNGIEPQRLAIIVNEWSQLLRDNNVEFYSRHYNTVKATVDDFLYLDPPYANTKGMYFGNFDIVAFFEWLGKQKSKYVLSFDGISGSIDNTWQVPRELYSEHVYLNSGNSSFRRVIGKDKNCTVLESLYVK